MPQSLSVNYVHIVFATKYREEIINENLEDRLYAYISEVCLELDSRPLIVGGYKNHVHILCNLSRKIALMTLVQKVKANSSRWMKTFPDCSSFSWQDGYAVFSVSPQNINTVKRYIDNQKNHHTAQSFKQEYLSMLDQAEIVYDEKWMWD